MKQIEIYTVGFSLPTLVTTCYQKDLAKVLERLDLLGKCVMLRTAGALHNDDVVEAVEPAPIERRPTLDELKIECFVKVRGWDEMIANEGNLDKEGFIYFETAHLYFVPEMKKFCENTYKVNCIFGNSVSLDSCGDYRFNPEMLTYVAPEAVK